MSDIIHIDKKKGKLPILIAIIIVIIPLLIVGYIVAKNIAINKSIPTELYTLRDAMSDGYLSGKGTAPVSSIEEVVKKSESFIYASFVGKTDTTMEFLVEKSFFGKVKDGQKISIVLDDLILNTPPNFNLSQKSFLLINSTQDQKFKLSDGYNSVFYIKNDRVYPANDITDAFKKYIDKPKDKFSKSISRIK